VSYLYTIVDDRPQEVYLYRHVRDQVCASSGQETWRDLGIELLSDVAALDIIKVDNGGDSRKCCSEMLKLWLQRQPTASWRQLLIALKQLKLFHLAGNVERLLKPLIPCDERLESTSSDDQQALTHSVFLQSLQYQNAIYLLARQGICQQQPEELESHSTVCYVQPENAYDSLSQTNNSGSIQPQHNYQLISNVSSQNNAQNHSCDVQNHKCCAVQHSFQMYPHLMLNKATLPSHANASMYVNV